MFEIISTVYTSIKVGVYPNAVTGEEDPTKIDGTVLLVPVYTLAINPLYTLTVMFASVTALLPVFVINPFAPNVVTCVKGTNVYSSSGFEIAASKAAGAVTQKLNTFPVPAPVKKSVATPSR